MYIRIMENGKYYKVIYENKNKKQGSFIVFAKNQNDAVEKARQINKTLLLINIFEFVKI